MRKYTITARYLVNRSEVKTMKIVNQSELTHFAGIGLKCVEAHEEFTKTEMRKMSKIKIAGLGLACSMLGDDAYSLFCASI